MFNIIFTVDYEIHGNGDGNPYELIVEPTDRLLRLFDRFGAKLTIMADVAEIMKFREYRDRTGVDRYHYEAIIEQLGRAVKNGHDVQLHVHSSYYNAKEENGRWKQDYSEYDLARLSYERLHEIIKNGKEFLESIIRQVKPDYHCFAFRAANWSMHPSENIIRALIDNGIIIDTSVFKYGSRTGLVNFDYSESYSDLLPWKVNNKDICLVDPKGKLTEMPIYCENRLIWAFLSVNRIFRVIVGLMHRLGGNAFIAEEVITEHSPPKSLLIKILSLTKIFINKNAWKMDFNQCTSHQMIGGLKRIHKKYGHLKSEIPVVLIGHSKTFTGFNERNLVSFLEYISQNSDRYCFGMFQTYIF